ncbi:MAG: CRISPR-associated protein Cas4 [Thermofilum sp.]
MRLLKEYAYCPRYAYLQLSVQRSYVTESMRAALALGDPLAGLEAQGWRVATNVRVASRRLCLWGYADALLVNGKLVRVVEVKALTPVSRKALRGRLRHFLAQAVAYGMCAEETLHLTLDGVVVLGREGAVLEKVTPALRRYVESLASGLRAVVEQGRAPAPLRGPKCGYCAYAELCSALGRG